MSAANQAVVGNNLTVTVTVSSSNPLGSWAFALSYDKNYLQLSSAPEGAHGTNIAGYVDSNKVKSKTYTYKFKVLKSGSSTIQVVSSEAYGWDLSEMTVSNGSKKVTFKTQAEIEASYSSDAYLKALGVTNYTITPTFDKKVNEYSLEVENDVEKVTITASKNDSNASLSGTGEKELKEGTNKFDIVVTAQKGNTLTYTLNITRKELNPIEVTVDSKKYFLVRKKADMLSVNSFEDSTIVYQGEEIPALKNDILQYTLVCLKDEEGNIKTFIYEDDGIKNEYYEITTNNTTILPKPITEEQKDLKVINVDIKGHLLKGLTFNNTSRQVYIKGINVLNGEEATYLYDMDKNSFIPASLDDLSMIDELNKKVKDYMLIIIVLGVIIFLLFILLIIKKPSKKQKEDKKEIIEEEPIVVEEKEEVVEEEISKKELKKKVKEEKKRLKEEKKNEEVKETVDEINIDEIKLPNEEIVQEETIVEEAPKEKKKKEKKAKKAKEVKKEEIKEEQEIDDPLNDKDDFVDFWD